MPKNNQNSGEEQKNESEHDATLRVFDTSDRLGKKVISWQWSDGRRTISPDEHEVAERLTREAEDRYDADAHEHGTVVGRVWMEDETDKDIEWVELDDDN